jgi:hypothetical protein
VRTVSRSCIIKLLHCCSGPRQRSRYSDSLRVGQSGDRILVGARYSAPVQTGPGAHPASYTLGTGSFPGVKRPGHSVDHPIKRRGSRKSRAIPLLPIWAYVACYRMNVTFTLIYIYMYMYIHIHVSDSVEIVCELPLLPNNTASEIFLHKSGKVGSVVTPDAGGAVSLKLRVLLNNGGLPNTKSNYSVQSRRSLYLLHRWEC